MFELMDKKKFAILRKTYLLNWPYEILLIDKDITFHQRSLSKTVYLQCLILVQPRKMLDSIICVICHKATLKSHLIFQDFAMNM